MDQKIFQYGKYIYDYYLQRSDRKTLAMTVYPSLNILVKAPLQCSEERINDFIKKKWMWLEKQLRFFKTFQEDRTPHEYVSGETFLYLGRQYKLQIEKGKINEVNFSKGKLQLTTKHDVRNSTINRKILEEWYKNRANEIFTERYKQILKRFKLEEEPILVLREMPKRWGSFVASKKVILNPQLIKASKDCIDYVVAHELCHATHKHHSRQFYKTLSRKYPHWERTKDKLELRFVGEH